ncbi:MAG: cysteine desulfurase-like protein [Acidobacteriaceae bacterium]|nr:cysteine desulfurase-like protein [Acidobacteriaceae bacterium]
MSCSGTADLDKGAGQFPIHAVRKLFPALNAHDDFVFFDNAAGAQVPQTALDAVNKHLLLNNVQRGGRYGKSTEVDAMIARARETTAILVNARQPSEIAFGMNATSFIRMMSLALGQTLTRRNEIILTDLDHEANIATWLMLARDGAKFLWWKVRDDGNLHTEDLKTLLSARTRLLACTVASNALGSIVDIEQAATLVHGVGAEIFLDCVHFGPHGVIDVQAWDCDYLVCSGYKIFAPHMGFLWGRHELLKALPTFREDFIPDEPPEKLEAGTFIYENVAGFDAAVRYLEVLAPSVSGDTPTSVAERRRNLVTSMQALLDYERSLSQELIHRLIEVGAIIYGIRDIELWRQRVPTVLFNVGSKDPSEVTASIARAGIGVRDGHMYAPRLMGRLGLDPKRGAVRASLVHYNTVEEIERFADVLSALNGHS